MRGTIEISPMYIYESGIPWELKLYILYLLFIVCLSLIKSFGLLRQIGFFKFSKRSNEITADSLASAASSNKMPKDFSAARNLFHQAEGKFTYVCEISSAKLQQLKQFANLNVLLGRIVVLMIIVKELNAIITTEITHTFFLSIIPQILAPFILGLIVSGALYVFCIFYEGVLARRKASWNYFCSQAESVKS